MGLPVCLANDFQLHALHAVMPQADTLGHSFTDIDFAALFIRPAVCNFSEFALPGADTGDAEPCAARQYRVRGSQPVWVKPASASGLVAPPMVPVPRCLPEPCFTKSQFRRHNLAWGRRGSVFCVACKRKEHKDSGEQSSHTIQGIISPRHCQVLCIPGNFVTETEHAAPARRYI